MNLTTTVTTANPNGGILPTLGTLNLANAVLTNNTLITDDPDKVAGALSSVLGSIVGQLVGAGIPPINLSSALGSRGADTEDP